MNWTAFGAIGELAGAAAVVVSLIYVSRQIRAGRTALETSTRDSVFRQLQEWNHVVMSDPVLGDLFQRGMQDLESLDRVERARMIHTMYSFFKVFENIYLHHLAGSIPADLWEGNKPILELYGSQPGGRAYWTQRRKAFDSRFIRVLDGLGPSPLQPAARLENGSEG
jgi:hypothetical protein